MKFETKVEKKEGSVVLVGVKMPFAEVEKKKGGVIEKLAENVEIEGFRKGKAPKDVVIKKLGESKILQEASQEVINEVFPEILKKEKLQIIGYPAISVTKLAPENDFEFTVEMAIYPEVKLPDYKKIAKAIKREVKKVGEEDIKKVEDNLIAMQNQMNAHNHDHKDGEKCDHDHEEVKELTDDFVKQLGPFENVADFKKKLEEDLKKEAETAAVAEHRGKIAEAILKEIKMDVPEILVNAELDKIIAQMKDDIARQGQDFEAYLKSQNKTEVDIRESYRDEAEKRAKIEIILKEIAKVEKIKPDAEEMKKQIETIMQAYGEANADNVSLYVENIMINEEVMKFLEGLSS
jgi:trigger factor